MDATMSHSGIGTGPGRYEPEPEPAGSEAPIGTSAGAAPSAPSAAGTAQADAALRPFFPAVHAAVLGAEQAARQAGRSVLAAAYEDQRLLALASVEAMLAHGQLALVALRWEPENLLVIEQYLALAGRRLADAQDAVTARTHLDAIAAQAEAARAPAQTSGEAA